MALFLTSTAAAFAGTIPATSITQQPITMAAWLRCPVTPSLATATALRISAANGKPSVEIGAYDQIFAGILDGSGNAALAQGGYLTAGNWTLVVGTFQAGWQNNNALVAVSVGGGPPIVDTATIYVPSTTPATLISLGLGGASGGGSATAIAEVSVWGDILGAADIAMLASGASPLRVRPGTLTHYWPLIGDGSQRGPSGLQLTPAAILPGVWCDHPPVEPPPVKRLFRPTYSVVLLPGYGSLLLSGSPPLVQADCNLTPASAALLFSANAPAVSAGCTLAPTAASLVLTGSPPSVSASANLAPAAATITLAANAPLVSAGSTLTPSPGGLLLSGSPPLVSASASVAPGPAAITLAGSPVSLSAGSTIAPGAAGLLLAGGVPLVSADANLSPAPGSILLSGAPVVLRIDFTIAPGAASILLAGSAPIVYTTGLAAVLVPGRRRVSATVDIRRVSATPDVRILLANPDIRRISSPRDD
jgi:hypothetical protein